MLVITIFYIKFSMIYKAAPAWTFKAKIKTAQIPFSPSPQTYAPRSSATLTKTPSWKMGRELRAKQNGQKSPSPADYSPPAADKMNMMGTIGTQVRGKQNHNMSPGPGSYVFSTVKASPSISFAARHQFLNKTIHHPGPGQYQLPQKKEKRGVIIGRDNRFTVQYPEKLNQPGPATYSQTRPNSATVAFGQAPRMSHQSAKNLQVGPGQYDMKSQFQRSGRGYTMSSKYKSQNPDATPGPSNYSPTHCDLTSSPKATISQKYRQKQSDKSPSPSHYDPQYRNLICKTESFSVGKAQRLPLYGNNQIPGPGAYLSTKFNNTGVEMSLGMSRPVEERDEVPGPGAYNPNKSNVLRRPQSAKMGKSKRFYKLNTEQSATTFYNSKAQSKTPKYSFTRKKRLQDKKVNVPGPGSYTVQSSMCNLSSYVFKK